MDRRNIRWLKPLAEAVLMVAAATGIAFLLAGHLGIANLALLYLVPVMMLSGRSGLKAGLATSALAVLAFNFFLVPPRFTLHVASADNLLTLLMLFAVALAVSELAARMRTQAERAESLAQASEHLAAFSEKLANADSEAEALAMLSEALAAQLGLHCRYLDAASEASPLDMASLDWAAARWAADTRERAGRGTAVMNGAEWMFMPLSTPGAPQGVIAVARDDTAPPVRSENDALFRGLIDRTSQAIGRIALARDVRLQESNRQREQLREALLSSIGHDLRTPLTAIKGGLEGLRVTGEQAPAMADIRAEVSRLERLVTNLLEMTKIEAGALSPHRDIIDPTDAIAAVLESLPPHIAGTIRISLPDDLPMLRADPHMLHHMLLNLLENAMRHGHGPEGIELRAMQTDAGLVIQVLDRGPGIDAAQADRLFERFQRIDTAGGIGGSGLGLAIVRGFGNALGVQTSAANRDDGAGAVFSITFPPNLLVPPS